MITLIYIAGIPFWMWLELKGIIDVSVPWRRALSPRPTLLELFFLTLRAIFWPAYLFYLPVFAVIGFFVSLPKAIAWIKRWWNNGLHKQQKSPAPPSGASSDPVSASSSDAVSELFPEAGASSTHTETARDVCPRCGHALRRRVGRFGPFLGCSAYPRCRYTRSPKIGLLV